MQEDRDRLRPHLLQGETLLWAEAPDPRAFALNAQRLALFVGVLGIFAWIASRQGPATFDYQHLWPLSSRNMLVWFFIVFGAVCLLSMMRSPQLTYGVTDRRALVLQGRYLWSYPPEAIDGLSPIPRRDGLTDLMFWKSTPPAGSGMHIRVNFLSTELSQAQNYPTGYSHADVRKSVSAGGFRGLRDVTEVRAHLERLRSSAPAPSGIEDPPRQA